MIMIARYCCSRQIAVDLFRHRLPAAMPRQSKFDKILPKVLAADWISRRDMLSLMRRLS
jgi:hypothetical protein